ncbi:hypothetical protein [Streptomyces sp. SudanB182_2057]|uniref:hypothetical protein n=1 Tax=Streptomyces sp. SudanB182_2057 TaxID=3035281 RepID=UPI003F5597C5
MRPPEPSRIGVRQVVTAETSGRKAVVRVDPGTFTCTGLAAELADEWIELMAATGYGAASCRQYRQAIVDFCRRVEESLPDARAASLAREDLGLHRAVAEWIRRLPARHPPGSRTPAMLAGRVRALVARRIQHPDRPVASCLYGWVDGDLGLRRGRTQELDEFTRADKRKLVHAAWADCQAIAGRIRAGRALAALGIDPADGGWSEPANLLWAVANDAWSPRQIAERLPSWESMPASLRDPVAAAGFTVQTGKAVVVRFLASRLFLTQLDLQPFRIALMAATGRAPEEVSALTEGDIEFGPRSVLIDFTKNRARRRTREAFSTDSTSAGPVLHPGALRLDAGRTLQLPLELSRPLAERAGLNPVPLFLRVSVSTANKLEVSRMSPLAGSSLRVWLTSQGITVEGAPDIRRLRKSVKVEKAVTFKGRVSDIADDHSEQTFRRHYAHGTTLRLIAGNVISAAQKHWLNQALNGPVVLLPRAETALDEAGAAQALGLSTEQVEQLRAGQLDMGVSSCKDPLDSPYGRPGQLCPVAPTRCLGCRNAFVLPSNLPQLLLFAAHLERLRLRLSPPHFHALWGQSRVNVTEAISARTDAEIALARQQITEQNLALHLPLAAHVEFDA